MNVCVIEATMLGGWMFFLSRDAVIARYLQPSLCVICSSHSWIVPKRF